MLFSSGCQKDKDDFIPYPLDGKITSMIDQLLDGPQSFEIQNGINQNVLVDKTIDLKVDAQSFSDFDGELISLEWTYAKNGVEMELYNIPHYASNYYLDPSYTFSISSPNEVSINNDKPIELLIESDLVEGKSLFFMSSEGWSELDISKLEITEWDDENGFAKSGFKVIVENLGWYSIASKFQFAEEGQSEFCLKMEGKYTQGNSKSLILFDNDIAVPITRSLDQGLFCTSMQIPSNTTIQVISLSNLREGEYEFFYLETEMENGLIVAPTFEAKSIEEIKIILENI